MNIFSSRSNPIDRCVGQDVWFSLRSSTAPYWIRIVKKEGDYYQCNGISDIVIRRLSSKTIEERKEILDSCLSKLQGYSLDSYFIEDAVAKKEFLTTNELFMLDV